MKKVKEFFGDVIWTITTAIGSIILAIFDNDERNKDPEEDE